MDECNACVSPTAMVRKSFKSHLTVLETSASLYASSPVFKLPQSSEVSGKVQEWKSITYRQFYNDVEIVAKYWLHTLRASGLPPRSVVGLWLLGWSYSDIVQFYGLSRAGYLPQLFSLGLPNPDVVFELLLKTGARALIYEPSYEFSLLNSPVSLHKAVDVRAASAIDFSTPLPPVSAPQNGDETAFIFHTSGSTSGSPRLVPCSYKWLDNIVRKAEQVGKPPNPQRTDVTTWMGSVCHIGQTIMLIGLLQHGACTVQPTRVAFSTDELSDMIDRCGVNRLHQFAAFIAKRLRESYTNPELLRLLRSLDEILYCGMSLGQEEEKWAYSNGIKLKNVLGSTECGPTMLSIGGCGSDASYLQALEGISYRFDPIECVTDPATGTNESLLEMIILSQSADCPDASLRSNVDGHFHTGDLFEEVVPGLYVFRGRDDDWIKSETGLRCDTKAIEDNVRAACSDLITECVVVGSGRPSPALFIEPTSGKPDHVQLKKDVFRRIQNFHARRYLHERIMNVDMIVVVDKGSLPRTSTKGNVSRRAVDKSFAEELNRVYNAV